MRLLFSESLITDLDSDHLLTLIVPAHFTEKYETLNIRKDENVVLMCIAYGEMPIKIGWAKDGSSLEKILNRYTLEEDGTNNEFITKLIISSSVRTDSGLFTCTASNEFGRDERHIELIIQGKPPFVTPSSLLLNY